MLKHPDVDPVLRALSETTRRAIYDRLAQGPATVSDLARPFDMTLAAVVQHIQVLEQAGLIRSHKLGRVRTCALEPRGLDVLADWVAQRRTVVERRLDRLGEILAEADVELAAKTKSNPQEH